MYGTQAALWGMRTAVPFENDVKMYGTQAISPAINAAIGLRMM